MNRKEISESVDLVLFFEAETLVRQMVYTEFEAVLDGVAGLGQFAQKKINCAYVVVKAGPIIDAIIFFSIHFDADGYPDTSWNLPLQDLVLNATVDFQFSVRCVYQSNFKDSKISNFLWNPSNNIVQLIQQIIVSNPLCQRLVIEQSAPTFKPVEENNLIIPENKGSANPASGIAPDNADAELLRKQVSSLREHLVKLESENRVFKEQSDVRDQQFKSLMSYVNERVKSDSLIEKNEMDGIKKVYEEDYAKKLKQRTSIFHQVIADQTRDMIKQDAVIRSLREELTLLRKDKRRLAVDGVDGMFEKLQQSGLNLVAFQAGAGHMSISWNDIMDYLDNPTAYAAKKCDVSEKHYQEWLGHYNKPSCNAVRVDGSRCGQTVERVHLPKEYIHSHSDRCTLHKTR
ncbi:MAG: hypothetical protein V4629_13455 [Pseudomonadota bacterium]